MSSFASSLTNQELMIMSRAYSHFCAIANAAEFHHRSRRNEFKLLEAASQEDNTSVPALGKQNDSCGGVIPQLLQQGISPKDIYESFTWYC